jgi:hypothetical protein
MVPSETGIVISISAKIARIRATRREVLSPG